MKWRAYLVVPVAPTDGTADPLEPGLRDQIGNPNVATAFNYKLLYIARDGTGFFIQGEGRPAADPDLPKGLSISRWVVTDSGTLDRPRAGSYGVEEGAIGHVSVFEKDTSIGLRVEWTLEVISANRSAALELFDDIRTGASKPKSAHRAARLSVRLRQWWRLFRRGTLSPQ